jgi:hypothetical protein
MRALYWSCMAIVSVVFGDAAGCGGRLEVADCGQGRQYCSEANVCCPSFTLCGNGKNGCPVGDCCLNTNSHVVDGGDDGESDGPVVTPTELPPVQQGNEGPTTPDPGSLPGNGGGGGGGGGGGSQNPVGGQKRW